MKYYDEYQKLMRYKYGYHSFFIVLILNVLNSSLSLFFNIQWAEMKEIETMVILTFAVIYLVIMLIYRGAYFTKWQSPVFYSVLFFILGIVAINLSLSPYIPLIVEGKVTPIIFLLILGLFYLAIPITYLIRTIIERKRDSGDIDEE